MIDKYANYVEKNSGNLIKENSNLSRFAISKRTICAM